MKSLFNQQQLQITIERLAHQLLENHVDFSATVLIGLQPRGIYLSDRIHHKLKTLLPAAQIPYGKLDITFYRDDFNTSGELHIAKETDINFSLENKKVVLVDDVLYTGRTIRAGLDALLDFGRPESVELLVLIDRRFSRELPIQPDYVGMTVDSVAAQKVRVLWQEKDEKDEVVMLD
ncbi:bifunctional pyr operon transcriptional regulator/uracil phosphoribosyltransferase PyrR [Taibaiella koreensis]|uniref:bifunctional pyr operon transcriptional regulator/uracil phosphoribosyltransferase PyrR n=1 Tax=Taibaiella koreensis TaxID=1268548 RepID=UPI000E599212|nr:bifunctional pyr operon transcriptional regulator/uracil phosphoribosyltransferase PyrR [Taibaiella koreensis]